MTRQITWLMTALLASIALPTPNRCCASVFGAGLHVQLAVPGEQKVQDPRYTSIPAGGVSTSDRAEGLSNGFNGIEHYSAEGSAFIDIDPVLGYVLGARAQSSGEYAGVPRLAITAQ